MTQEQQILQYLEEHRTINFAESWRICGVFRLSSVIHRLRKAGHFIVTTQRSINGKPVTFYKLIKGATK